VPALKSGHKKTRPEQVRPGFHLSPACFSELFNVAASRPAQMTTERISLIFRDRGVKPRPAAAWPRRSKRKRRPHGEALFLFAFSVRLS
jgi:hypothetical protein